MQTLYQNFTIEPNENEFYINKNAQITGEHEIHKGNCPCLPTPANRLYLSKDCTFYHAEYLAHIRGYYNTDACKWCLTKYHKR